MPRRDLISAKGTDLFEKNNSKQPNISHSWMTDITGMSKSAVGRVIQDEEEL